MSFKWSLGFHVIQCFKWVSEASNFVVQFLSVGNSSINPWRIVMEVER
uniref:Uncharacterized protein n=1 Tax=Rhizophora mucronata TaxID=61149 RepID=A0A2P2NZA4_RHIMU